MRSFGLVIALSFSLMAAGAAIAKDPQCKDAAGKFIKCPPAAAATAPKTVRCKDAKGKFIACPKAAAGSSTPAASATPPKTVRCKDAKGKFIACPKAAAGSSTPAASAPASIGAPAGATAKCKDGTYSMSKTHSGACSHHGGVANWL